AREARPFTVGESIHGLREESPPDNDGDRARIVFPHIIAQRTTQWERGDEPMTRIEFTGDRDAYGQPRWSLRIACPRGWNSHLPSAGFLVTVSKTDYAGRDDDAVYHVNRVARST